MGRPLSKQDIESNTPFNTYVIAGLPPAPICNPGRAALEAVVNPSRTNDLYFVADGSGGHVFSDNYDLHQRYVARLRTVEAERAAKEAALAPPPMARAPETAKAQPVPQQAQQPPQQAQGQPTAADAVKTPEQLRLEAAAKFEPVRPEISKLETRPEPVTFVAPSIVPLPPTPPQGLREKAGAPQKPGGTDLFDLSTSKVVPKLN